MFAFNEEKKRLIDLLDSAGYVVDEISSYEGISEEATYAACEGAQIVGYTIKICKKEEGGLYKRLES